MAAGDISDAISTELGYRLEDTTPKKYPTALRFEAMNYAQLRIVGLLDNRYLSEFQAIKSAASISGGSVSFTTIDSGGIINGAAGIIACKVTPGGGTAQWAKEYDVNRLRIQQGSDYFTGSDTNVLYYIWAKAIYFLITTYTAAVADILYLDYPAEITTDVDPILNVALHPILIDFAEAYCWGTDSNEIARRKEAEDKALLQIKILNEKVGK